MYKIDLVDRKTNETAVADYASGFESYAEAREWADRNELGFRACGWTAVVVVM